MKIVLIANNEDSLLRAHCDRKCTVINDSALKLEYIEDSELSGRYDTLVIADNARTSHTVRMNQIRDVRDVACESSDCGRVLLFTNSIKMYHEFIGEDRIHVIFLKSHVSKGQFQRALQGKGLNKSIKNSDKTALKMKKGQKAVKSDEEGKSFFDRFKKKRSNQELHPTTQLNNELGLLGSGISRTVAVTGNRGSGLTSVAVNLATQASELGLSVMLIDMDIMFRGFNLYINRFNEATKDVEDLNSSLIRLLARPDEYKINTLNLGKDFFVSSLGYDFVDQRLIDKFYTSDQLISTLSLLKNKFNLVIIDIPMEVLETFKRAMIHIDTFALCMDNSLYSLLTTVRNVDVRFSTDEAKYLNSKAKIVLNKYNASNRFQDNFFTPELVIEVLASGVSDKMRYPMKHAGLIRVNSVFDTHIENDIPSVKSDASVAEEYKQILVRLLEGA